MSDQYDPRIAYVVQRRGNSRWQDAGTFTDEAEARAHLKALRENIGSVIRELRLITRIEQEIPVS